MNWQKKCLTLSARRQFLSRGPLQITRLSLLLLAICRIVLLGEATHGTHEFYTIRAEITQQLITQKGFHAVAIEGDWPDAYQVNRYVHGQNHTAMDALWGI